MKINDKINDKKRQNKTRIAKLIRYRKQISKPELASELGLSMPTVLQNVKELVESGIVEEAGEYESTGGRKAKTLSVVPYMRYAAGIDITANHVSFVLIDLKGDVVYQKRMREHYENVFDYYGRVAQNLESFLEDSQIDKGKLLGVGISLPGIIDNVRRKLVRSHILQVSDINLEVISRLFPYPVNFENDANSAAIAELQGTNQDAVYLSLSNTVGGSIYMNETIYSGDHFRSAEFGHMILVPEGKTCYCGKRGCVDAYCSAKVLTSCMGEEAGPSDFFQLLNQGDQEAAKRWDTFLYYLAITVTNLRMVFDCDIILGGYIGGDIKPYLPELERKVLSYNKFDNDTLYLKTCSYEKEASAVGIAMTFLEEYLETFL